MAWVYILKTRIGKYYVGSTVDLEERMRHHQNGNTPTTFRFGFESCVFKQEYATLSEARKIEFKLKRLKRRDYIEKIIKEGYIRMRP